MQISQLYVIKHFYLFTCRYVYHEGGAPRSMDELRAKIAMAGDHVDREAIRKCFRKSKARAQGITKQSSFTYLLYCWGISARYLWIY